MVKQHEQHNHSLDCADGLRSTPETRATFFDHFESHMSPAVALDLHRRKLGAQADGETVLANGALNPSPNIVYHWFRMWRNAHYGEDLLDPLSKLAEKAPVYLEKGTLLSALTVNWYT